ncbi:type II toxin-antitoxin system VapC family toxin [Candidatus Albibeggiatoa sp. nov. BB20]|uniref:type II toxin-antitoxin system VapC family toxin n=1 Tax=Candidatus Albibeggiatoa sp. nov. BB20 TaxID=3162723 RepID=UPI00336576CA
MKNIVDSCAWLAYFADEKNARIFAEPIEDIENLIVPSVVLTEVFKVIYRQTDENTALQAIAHIQQGEVIPLDNMLSIDAGFYGVQYKLPLADSIIYATSKKYNAIIWTQDNDFKGLENIKYYTKT